MNNAPDDKKISVDEDEESKIPSRRADKKTFATLAREKVRDYLNDLKAEISLKYVATVAGAVFLCIVAIGAVLVIGVR